MKHLLIGAHTSASGGVHHALFEGEEIGATTIQLFTANQRRWQSKEFSQDQIVAWKDALDKTGMQSIMSHASYLINLGAPNSENLHKSRDAFRDEIIRCKQLGLTFLNIHPGAALNESHELCIEKIIESILLQKKLLEEGPTCLLLETTAGQGSSIGAKFEEIAAILEGVRGEVPVGVCVDTCHIFAAGYDLRTHEAFDASLKEFDKVIGLKHLKAFHLNDSQGTLGSRKDRHKPLGEGEIGIDCFKFLMQDKRTQAIPKYLETPDGPPLWVKEIQMLRDFADVKK